MSKTSLYSAFLLALIAFSDGVKSQPTIVGQDLFYADEEKISIPFEIEQGFIIVKVWIQGILPLKMIFDTGAENTILFDHEIGDILGIKLERQINITGSDLDSVITAHIARSVKMRLVGARMAYRDIIILDNNNLLLKEKLGIDINGILGGTFFNSLVTKIDYRRRKITFYKPQSFAINESKYQVFDIDINNHKPYLTTYSKIANEKDVKVKLLLDTGASLPYLLHTNTDPDIILPEKHMIGNVGYGLSGIIKGYIGRSRQLDLGIYQFDNIVTSFQEVNVDTSSFSRVTRNGILGNTLLSRFEVIIDYSKEKLYLKGKRKYNKDFNFDRSGLTLFSIGPDLKQYYVVNVIESSPAYEAGVRPGDLIQKINGRRTNNLHLQDINDKLSQKEGKKIRLVILRNEEKIKLEFRLREWHNNLN